VTFEAWTAELVRTIRETIPDAKAMRRGLTATITNGDRIVRVEQTGGTVWCCAGDGGPQGFTLAIGDHTPATARNAGISLASHLRDEKPVAHVCQENGG
jgi:hypothetical protein